MNSKLFKKSFDLKNLKTFGGMVDQHCYNECVQTTNYREGCTDSETTITTDTGAHVETCVDYDCP